MKPNVEIVSTLSFSSPIDEHILYLLKHRYSGDNEANPECSKVIISAKSYEKLLRLSSRDDQNQYEQILTTKTTEKWLGYQGGSFSKATLVAGALNYYDLEDELPCDASLMRHVQEVTVSWHNAMGLITRIDPIISDSRELYNTYKPTHRSSRGVTGLGDRRPKENQIAALRLAVLSPLAIDEIIGGMRYKDGKYRNIWIDSQANYYREARVLHRWFQWWVSHPSDMHSSDYAIANEIVLCHAAFSYAADYKGMDFHFCLEAALAVVVLFGACTQATADEISYIKMFVEELFHTPVVIADEIWYGLHKLLSGLYPTHDIESFLNFSILLTTAIDCNFNVVYRPRKLRANEVYIKVCGDDSYVIFGRKPSDEEIAAFRSRHEILSAAFGQILEVSKVDVSDDIVTFCKKTFALRQDVKGFKHYSDDAQTPIHKYPLNKAIHNLRRPENLPEFSDSRSLVIWTCSIMDLSYGMRDYKSVMIMLYQQNRELFNAVDYSDFSIDPNVEIYLNSDWFFRNYVSFGLENSPSWRIFSLAKEKNL